MEMIRDHTPRLALAPMDGVTDWAFRDLLTRLASRDASPPSPSSGSNGGSRMSVESVDGSSIAHNAIDWCVSEFVRITQRPAPATAVSSAWLS